MSRIAGLARVASPPAARSALVDLLVSLLRPLVRLMLKHGMTAYEFGEVSRWVFAHTAMDREHFAVRGRDVWSMTKSRAALLTGLTRREVDRLVRMREPAVQAARASFHRTARILAAWLNEPGYQDERGRPRDLLLKGEQDSLEQLIRHHCRDIPVRAVIDELEDRGCIARQEDGRVRFVHGVTGGLPLPADVIETLAGHFGHFAALVERRVDGIEPLPQFIEVTAGPIAQEHRDTLQRRLHESAAAYIAQLNRDLATHPKSLLGDQHSRVVIGVYNGFA